MLKKSRPARPQTSKTRGVASGYVEDLNEARTRLADFFSILLRPFLPGPHPSSRNHPVHTLNGFEHLIEMLGV